MTKPQIILASASIGRKDLLDKLGIPFRTLPSTIDEDNIIHADPDTMLESRARTKAEDVVQKLNTKYQIPALPAGRLNTKYLVVAADSMAVLGGKTFGKAKDKSHAGQILKALMGKTHIFATATCLLYLKRNLGNSKRFSKLTELNRWQYLTKTSVTLRKLSPQSLSNYINRYDFTKFAAGYALNETPWDLVTKIEGSYTNVIGLPFEILLPIFSKLKLI